jgi:hypothetical protein
MVPVIAPEPRREIIQEAMIESRQEKISQLETEQAQVT